MNFLVKLFDADKIGGYVRAGVSALLGIGVAKSSTLAAVLSPETQVAIAAAVSALAVGIWSHIAKKIAG